MEGYRKKMTASISALAGTLLFVILTICPVGVSAGTRGAAEPLLPDSQGEETLGNETVTLDVSNTAQGYFMVRYDGANPKVKISVKIGGVETIYDMKPDEYGEYEALPLTAGSGIYEAVVYEHVQGISYNRVYEGTIEAELDDELLPFLHPSTVVDYDADSYVVQKAAELSKTAHTDFEVVEDIYLYLSGAMEYDYDSPYLVQEKGTKRYIPDVDSSLLSGKGICMDYATIMAAMLRSQGVPTKLVIGPRVKNLPGGTEETLHAWVSIYISDAEIHSIYFDYDGELPGWVDLDPTHEMRKNSRGASIVPEYASYYPEEYY